MTRTETTIEERGEPSLIFTRRNHPKSPLELVIVEKGLTRIYTVNDQRCLILASELTGHLATRPTGAP